MLEIFTVSTAGNNCLFQLVITELFVHAAPV